MAQSFIQYSKVLEDKMEIFSGSMFTVLIASVILFAGIALFSAIFID